MPKGATAIEKMAEASCKGAKLVMEIVVSGNQMLTDCFSSTSDSDPEVWKHLRDCHRLKQLVDW